MPVSFGPFVLDHAAATLQRDGVLVSVQPKVIELLDVLSRAPGHIHSRQELLDRIWPDTHVSEDALHQLLRRTRRALEDDPDAPRWIEAVARRGWRFIGEVRALPDAAARAGARALRSPVAGGPRSVELERVREAVTRGETLLLHGVAGVGKTWIARAALVSRRHVWVDVHEAHTADDVIRAVAATLSVPLDGLSAAAAGERVSAALRFRGLPLVLDGAETVATVLAPLVAEWRRSIPLLVTSRRALTGTTLETEPVLPLCAAEARALFLELARSARGNALPAGEVERVEAIVARLDGLPLALELAASRLRLLSAADLLSRLGDPLGSATRGALRTSLDTSCALLNGPDRALFTALAVLPGPFHFADVEALVGEDPNDGLERLADASLLAGVAPELRLLETVRAFAMEKLEEAGRRSAVEGAWTTELRRRADALFPAFFQWEPAALQALAALRGPLLSHLGRAQLSPQAREALARALAASVRYSGPWSVARDALEGAVAALKGERGPQGPDPVHPWTWALLGEYRIRTGDPQGGAAALTAALGAGAGAGDGALVAFSAFLRSRLHPPTGEADA